MTQTLHAQIGEHHYQATVYSESNGYREVLITQDGRDDCTAALHPDEGLEPLDMRRLGSQLDDWAELERQFRAAERDR